MDEHSALVVTASTGKAAKNVHGTTHAACRDKKDNFQKIVNPKALLVDQISLISKLAFSDFNVNMPKV